MNQTKLESLIETLLNIASGFIVSLVVWWVIAPLYGIPVNISSNLQITGIFTITSIIRSYYWRRFFAIGLHQKISDTLKKFNKKGLI